MRKGKKTIAKTATVSALAAVMAVSMGVTAFAADADDSDVTKVEGDTSAKITKNLEIAKEGVTVPTTAFTFRFESQNGAPDISDKVASTTSSLTKSTALDGKTTVSVETAALLSDGDISHFTETGIFNYKLTEVAGNTSVENGTVTYDTTSYDIEVKVTRDSDNKLQIAGITAKKTGENSKLSIISFTNKFTKSARAGDEDKGGENTPNPSYGLKISNEIVGSFADTSANFTYTIQFTEDPVNKGLPLTAISEVADAEDNKVKSLDYGKNYTFTLSNDEDITFNVPAGTSYTVIETGKENYTPNAELVENGVNKGKISESIGKDLTVTALAGEGDNSVAFTNEYYSSPLTGLISENAPFIAMVALAVVSLAGYIVSKRRRTV